MIIEHYRSSSRKSLVLNDNQASKTAQAVRGFESPSLRHSQQIPVRFGSSPAMSGCGRGVQKDEAGKLSLPQSNESKTSQD